MREMKDSGVAWIGEVPLDWTIIPTKYLFNIESGATPRSENPDYFDGDIVWITPADYKTKDVYISAGKRYLTKNGFDSCSAVVVPAGSIIFTKRAPIGNVAICATELCTNQGCLSCVPKAGDSTKFFYYLMSICTDAYNLLGSGTTFKEISAFSFANFILIRPMLQEQQKIAAYLDKQTAQVDALITNIQTQIEKLKAYKQSMITEVVTKGLDPTVPMKDSGVEWIGEIPKHWSVIPSKFLFANCDERRREGDVQLTASQKYGMISQEEYMRRENARIVLADKGLENWKHVEPFDFVISLRSFQGGLEMSEVPGCATWHYIILRARQRIHPYYYKWLFKSSMYITTLQRTCNYIRDGQDLRYSNFVKVPLCIPTLYEQQKIADFLDRKCAKIDHLITLKQSKIEKLEQYKRSLIYEYVTGKREVI